MKVLVLKNNISKSLKKKLNSIKSWFSYIDLEFTEEKSKFKDIKMGDYSYIDGNNELQFYQAPDETWYDENISKPSKQKGYDIVIFLVKGSDWGNNFVEGFGTTIQDCGIQEIAIKYFSSGKYTFAWGDKVITYSGDKLEWIIIHELLHRLYQMKGLLDNTHKYFLEGKPEKCLEDFKMKTWKYFKLNEKTGSLGHTVADLDTKLVDMLDKLRGICGFPFVITSGYRTPSENAKIKGSVAGSAHTKRLAVDILCTDSKKRIKIIGEAYLMGFVGIGADKEFVHLDINTSDKQRVWLY